MNYNEKTITSDSIPSKGQFSSKRHNLAGWLLLFGDVVAFLGAFAFTYWLLSPQEVGLIDNRSDLILEPVSLMHRMKNELSIFHVLASVVLFLFYNKRHYGHRIPWWSQLQYVAYTCFMALLADGFIHYVLEIPFPIEFLICQWVSGAIFVILMRQVMRFVGERMGIWKIPTVMVGDGDNAIYTLFALSSDRFPGYRVDKILLRKDNATDFDHTELPADMRHIKLEDGSDEALASYIPSHRGRFYIIALDTFRGEERDNIIRLLEANGVEYAIVPPIKRVSLFGMEPHVFFGHDTLFLRPKDTIHAPLALAAKRLMDFFGALIGLICASPLFIVVWLLKRKDGTKMYFGHKRLGKDGEMFMCWKFQSMVPNAQEVLDKLLATNEEAKKEWERDFKLKKDPRVTPVGNFLRKTSLDEIPQLFNVLKGEMSLVGPRPITLNEAVNYGEHIEAYKSVKPGVTGLWQVNGRNDTTYEQRVYLDSWYVRNWSVWHDIVILFKTVRILVFRSGAY